jgi:hypothetical protein
LFLPICRDLTDKQGKTRPPVGYMLKSRLKQTLMNPAQASTSKYYNKFLGSKCDMIVVVSFSEGRANGLS